MFKVAWKVHPDIDICFTNNQAFVLRYYRFSTFKRYKNDNIVFEHIVNFRDFISIRESSDLKLNRAYKSRIRRLWKKVVR